MSAENRAQLQEQLDAALETIAALSKRMRQLETKSAQLPFQKQLQSYQQNIAEKSHELAIARNWSELIVQNSMDAIVRIDENGVIQAWNPMSASIFGYKEFEVLGLLIENILAPKCLLGGQRGVLQVPFEYAKAESLNLQYEGTAQSKSGAEIPVEFVGFEVKQAETKAYAMVLRDISERKQAELSLRDSHANLEVLVEERAGEARNLVSMIDAAPNLVAMADLQDHILYMNPAGRKVLGMALDGDLDSLSIDQIHDASTYKQLKHEIFPKALEHGTYDVECEFIDADNQIIPMSCTFMALRDLQDNHNRFAVIARDLRPERHLQNQVEHVDRLESLGVLAGGIAHDFNNILTAIIGNAGMAQRKLDAYSPGQEYLKNIEQSSLQAANLCKQMLAYSGKGAFVIQPMDVSHLIDEMAALLEVSVDKNVVLKFDLSQTLPAVEADLTQMQQIIMNLVINASEAIDKHSGVIAVGTGVMEVDAAYLQQSIHKGSVETGCFVYVEVSDSGCGMDAETCKKIFDPFFTTKLTGRGLGMSAVLGIVHGHGGILNIYSELNKGTTFKVAIPVSEAPSEHSENTTNLEHDVVSSGLILVVDDEEMIRNLARMALEDIGFEVITAVDGQDGVEVFCQHKDRITGVLLDMTMPRMSGEDCYCELRKHNPNIKVILSSGYNAEDATSRFQGKGLAGFIQKPYLIDHFQKVVAECFKSKTSN